MTLSLDAPPAPSTARPPAPRPSPHSPTPPALTTPPRRIPGLDLARFIACLGVIWLHFGVPPYNALGYFRLPFFSLLLAFLAAGPLFTGKRSPFSRFVLTRVHRLLLPFLTWAVLYRILSLATGGTMRVELTLDSILLGFGAWHLWFLPFAFCASLASYAMARALASRSPIARRRGGFVLLAAGLAGSFVPIKTQGLPQHVAETWLPLGGALLMGVALPLLLPALSSTPRRWPRAAGWAALAALLAVGSASVPLTLANFLGTLSGLALFLAGLTAPLAPAAPTWKYLGQLSYGMYLAHFGFGRIFSRLGLDTPAGTPLRFLLTVVCSMALAAFLLRLPWGRFLLGIPAADRLTEKKPVGRQQSLPA